MEKMSFDQLNRTCDEDIRKRRRDGIPFIADSSITICQPTADRKKDES